jgi:hypothetical protein
MTEDRRVPILLQLMALGYIHAWLAEDYWTIAVIDMRLAELDATPREVAESFSLAAASLLTDAYQGSSGNAQRMAARKWRIDAARMARTRPPSLDADVGVAFGPLVDDLRGAVGVEPVGG